MKSTLCLIPAFHHQKELDIVCEQLSEYDVLIIDDGSVPMLSSSRNIIRHHKNLGYGASQKTGFSFALAHKYERVALIHGDNQYSIPHILEAAHTMADISILLGSRFLSSSPQMPFWRKWGNQFLTSSVNHRFHVQYSDLHTGGRVYATDFLRQLPYHSFSNDFVFDHQLLLWAIRSRIAIHEFPIPAKYDDSVSSISFSKAIPYGIGCILGLIAPSNR